MSFMKSLLLAIIATLFLTYVFGASVIDWFNVDVYMDDELLEPVQAIGFAALFVVVLVIAALAIVLSVFGSIIFIVLLIFGGGLMFMLGMFWPIVLIACAIWLVSRSGRQATHSG
ncbi:hypothetical protein SG34_025290 [Thalassomonas viridans]|uniref:Uncharacterized protein n=1 Tax=Thalassomonas viridans TaxID=137584 RepID=A0AAE9Z118_9GAMM|nr:hypothetical protein [Thalassomonas viridans]WDE04608.1 hypothetical protein SG34_025290 [Thalassomonas viridans]